MTVYYVQVVLLTKGYGYAFPLKTQPLLVKILYQLRINGLLEGRFLHLPRISFCTVTTDFVS